MYSYLSMSDETKIEVEHLVTHIVDNITTNRHQQDLLLKNPAHGYLKGKYSCKFGAKWTLTYLEITDIRKSIADVHT